MMGRRQTVLFRGASPSLRYGDSQGYHRSGRSTGDLPIGPAEDSNRRRAALLSPFPSVLLHASKHSQTSRLKFPICDSPNKGDLGFPERGVADL